MKKLETKQITLNELAMIVNDGFNEVNSKIENFRKELRQEIKTKTGKLRQELQNETSKLRQDIKRVEAKVDFNGAKIDLLSNKFNNANRRLKLVERNQAFA